MIPSVSSMGYTPAAASLNPDQIAEAFSEQKTFQEKSNFVQGLRASYNIGYLACSWIENGANPLSLASLLPHLTLNEMQVLKTFRDIQKDIQICIKNIFDCDPSKNKFFTECCGIFDLLSENDLENWISSLDLPLPVMGFLIAALPAAKKSRYLRILAEKFHYEMTYYYASSRTAMLWRSGEADRHYLAKVTLQNCPSRSRLEFLHNTSLKNPTLFTYFLVELNPIEMSYLQEILSDTLICRGLQYVSSSYTFCKQVIEKLNRNGGATLLVNVVNFNFQSSIAGSVRTSLAALPSHIGFADLELDEQGFDNFALNFETGIQKIPPLLIALGALDDNLTDWLIKASRLFTESQLSMFFWTLPYPKIKQHLPFILTNLSGSYLETVLKAIPSDLRNQALDTKVQEISLPLLAAKNALKDFYFDSSDDESTVCGMLNLVCHWKEKLSELLYHPKALPFWHVGSNYHNLMSYKSEIKNTLESYENKVKEIQARQLKTIDALPTFKESPPLS